MVARLAVGLTGARSTRSIGRCEWDKLTVAQAPLEDESTWAMLTETGDH